MSNITIFGDQIYEEYRPLINYNGKYFYVKNDYGNRIKMKESELINYLMNDLRNEYYQDHLMTTFLQNYVIEHFKRNHKNHGNT